VNEAFSIRLAREDDIQALEVLIPLSVRSLQAPFYSPAQMEAALAPVFGVDRQLISDGTYFIVEHSGHIVGCGGWNRRRALFGGDRARLAEDAQLDSAHDVDAVHDKAAELGLPIVYPLTDEPWGGRRFFVTDPNGVVINVMSHRK
jgi:catechol 2,3-dioxygenase-like lactoylglutathione lyase family enzyme